MSEWTELKDLQDVAQAQAGGWEIEFKDWMSGIWTRWGGAYWNNDQKYRGRPKQPKPVPQDAGSIVKFSDCRDGLWAHFNLGDGSYQYSINLDADAMSKKFADAYRKKFSEPKPKIVTSECWRNAVTGSLCWQEAGLEVDAKNWERVPAWDFKNGEVKK